MKHKRNLIIIMLISLAISIIRFVLDSGERVPNVAVNIFEITVMTIIIFGIASSIYVIITIYLIKRQQ